MIDWKRVCELREEIGPDEFDEVVDLFIEEVEMVMNRLRTDPRPGLYVEDLHFLKGCAMNIGFKLLARNCLTGEGIAAGGNPERVDIAGIIECYETSKQAFLEGVEGGLAA
ncbi:hypothetical protein CLV78_11240 [Aliiruegeria haliotis]|uniref:Hpt domain-containing protein n=1 Tax=Aliiruegeria haliotis TaxID=1280846 RepID=A0A2T0RHQ4_9RHOB|nr:Hpt domain-containing protein [Aliiruegeria haliotis]PRY20667.1 hypothetical protein CLV78_11240 [Aliiruegeria haliotis]